MVVAQDGFVGTEAAAEPRRNTQHREEIGGDAEAAGHLGGLAGCCEAHVREAVAGDLAVARHLGFQIEVVGRRDGPPGILGRGAIDAIQSSAVLEGERSQEDLVEHAERRRSRADPEPEREDRDDREAGSPPQRSDGEAEVTQDGDESVDQHVEAG